MNATFPFRSTSLLRIATFALMLVTTRALFAGTPLICFPFEIGSAKSLPGGRDWPGVTYTYDRTNLIDDTLALLTPAMPILVRMETLRRAAVYANPARFNSIVSQHAKVDSTLAMALLQKLRERAAALTESNRALALFDLGYFSETLRHAGLDPAVDGFPLLAKSLEMRGGHDAGIEFALALAASYPKRPEQAEYLARARAGAESGSLLAQNIDSHFNKS